MTIQYSTQDTYIDDLMQGRGSPILVNNSSSRLENQSGTVIQPASLHRSISPPPSTRRRPHDHKSSTAAVEAGEKDVEDHLSFFSQKLLEARRPVVDDRPRLDHQSWIDLYTRNCHDQGHHFVIHQHDHPIAGTHYDLRLQCNATSSISFAIMYGLPGDPNSKRLNRNATETRVHTLWNHLIETASHQTGSMLIWDTGEYSVIPFHDNQKYGTTTDEEGDEQETKTSSERSSLTEPQKLHRAFGQRRIRLRLDGTRLPKGYTISLRLTTENFQSEQPHPPKRKKRRVPRTSMRVQQQEPDYNTTDSDSDPPTIQASHKIVRSSKSTLSCPHHSESPPPNPNSSPPSKEQNGSYTTSQIVTTNAYPGATNTINSIHQRRWFLSLDRRKSGFVKHQLPIPSPVSSSSSNLTEPRWIHQHYTDGGSRPSTFQVQGREIEYSVVTGRLASEILDDEGVEGFIPRGGWKAVTH